MSSLREPRRSLGVTNRSSRQPTHLPWAVRGPGGRSEALRPRIGQAQGHHGSHKLRCWRVQEGIVRTLLDAEGGNLFHFLMNGNSDVVGLVTGDSMTHLSLFNALLFQLKTIAAIH